MKALPGFDYKKKKVLPGRLELGGAVIAPPSAKAD